MQAHNTSLINMITFNRKQLQTNAWWCLWKNYGRTLSWLRKRIESHINIWNGGKGTKFSKKAFQIANKEKKSLLPLPKNFFLFSFLGWINFLWFFERRVKLKSWNVRFRLGPGTFWFLRTCWSLSFVVLVTRCLKTYDIFHKFMILRTVVVVLKLIREVSLHIDLNGHCDCLWRIWNFTWVGLVRSH